MSETTITGGCHCKALRFELHWPGTTESAESVKIPGRRCSCSFCMRFHGVWTSHPQAKLDILEDPDHPATAYRFGTETADFLFCSRCGIAPLVTSELDGQLFAVVNVNTFDDREKFDIDLSDSCFDGESTNERLDRRKARWIGRVRRKRRPASEPPHRPPRNSARLPGC